MENPVQKNLLTFRWNYPHGYLKRQIYKNVRLGEITICCSKFFSGIYHHVKGKQLGMLTVKIVGYNDTNPNNKYYIAMNSWGTKWGDKGHFKIRRGVDECMIDGNLRGISMVDDDDDDDDK